MKHWRKTSGVRIGRVVSSFSLIVLAVCAWAGSYGDLSDELAKAKSLAAKREVLRASEIEDERLEKLISRSLDPSDRDPDQAVRTAEEYAQLMAIAEASSVEGDQSKAAKRIKDAPFYRDIGEGETANWLSGSMRRLGKIFERKESRNRGMDMPQIGAAPNFFGFLIPMVWCLLGALLIGFIIYAARFISFSKSKKRKAKAMLEEDEPERTLDEWLALADSHEREGRYREAVRALYLACLLKFDERNVARFIRSQTNWEHLARIESSPRLPTGLQFRSATQAFDQVWYGHKVRGSVDVDEFRSWYRAVTDALKAAAA